jgi:hypothetical protein
MGRTGYCAGTAQTSIAQTWLGVAKSALRQTCTEAAHCVVKETRRGARQATVQGQPRLP